VRAIGAETMPAVVFITAHDQYAIQAFEINALDYLLKPVIEERFVQTLARAKSRIRLNVAADSNRQIIGLLETIASPRTYLKRLAVRSAGKTVFLDVGNVDWIGAAENYVELHVGRANHLLHVTMNAFEKSLDPEIFRRIHRSIIVNIGRIRDLQSDAHGEYFITLRDGTRLRSGRIYADRLKALANNPF
jgi:two-component system, LytTR family, response regulator